MIRRHFEVREERRESVRGGVGTVRLREVVASGDMVGVDFVSLVTLEPGASIGEHRHEGSEELYLILEGEGTASLDGTQFSVGRGDSYIVKDGHTHGLANGPERPLSIVAVLASTLVSR
jgi:mannose-6-phosphate isomerase-like protein (cupin superfamily)